MTPRWEPRSAGVPRALKSWRSLQLIATAELLVELLEHELEPVGVTWRRCKILAMIGALAPTPQIVVADRLGIDRTTMSEETRDLIDLMLVLALPRGRDGRRTYLELTGHGEQVLAHAEYQVGEAEQRVFGRLGLVHGRKFAEYLARIAPPQKRR